MRWDCSSGSDGTDDTTPEHLQSQRGKDAAKRRATGRTTRRVAPTQRRKRNAVREKCDSAGVPVCKRKSRRRTADAPRQTRNCGGTWIQRWFAAAQPRRVSHRMRRCAEASSYGIIRIPTHRPMTETGRLNDRLAARTAAGQLFILPQERFYCKKAGSRRQDLPRSQKVLASLCLQRREMTFRILLRGRSSPPRSRARTNGSRAFLFENVDPAKVGYKKDESYAPSKGRHRNGKHAKKNP